MICFAVLVVFFLNVCSPYFFTANKATSEVSPFWNVFIICKKRGNLYHFSFFLTSHFVNIMIIFGKNRSSRIHREPDYSSLNFFSTIIRALPFLMLTLTSEARFAIMDFSMFSIFTDGSGCFWISFL